MLSLRLAFAFATLGGPPRVAPASEDEVRRWIADARAGGADGARSLYRAYAARVFRSARPLVKTDADAEDVTQETFIRAFEALDRYESRPDARFVSWLLMIALNVARKKLRFRRRTVTVPNETAEAYVDDAVSAPGVDPPMRSALLSALAELSERDREIVVLRYGAELDATEIATIVGTSPANVRKVLERRRRELAERLAAFAPLQEGASP